VTTKRVRWAAGVGSVVLGAAAWTAVGSASSPEDDELPRAAHSAPGAPSEDVDEWIRNLPDRIAVSHRDEASGAGFIRKDDYLRSHHLIGPPDTTPPGQQVPEAPLEVLDAEDRLVGHLYPGFGFVSLEERAAGFDPRKAETPPTTVVER
jgi:hypothetical protein